MFDRAVIMAQCSWHCNYKDFPQHLIRWCFHAPASVIRLTQADFLYVNQVFIRLFPPEKISFLHANAPVLPRHCSWIVCRSQCRPPARALHSRGSVHLLEPRCSLPSVGRHECMKARVPSVALIFFWKLDMFLRDYPTLWAAVWRKIPLSQLQKRDSQVCYYLLTAAGLEPQTTEEESRYSCKFLN